MDSMSLYVTIIVYLLCVLNPLTQVEATGSEKIASDAINYVRRGGTLMIYGVYDSTARVHWSPSKIFLDEIRVRKSMDM